MTRKEEAEERGGSRGRAFRRKGRGIAIRSGRQGAKEAWKGHHAKEAS